MSHADPEKPMPNEVNEKDADEEAAPAVEHDVLEEQPSSSSATRSSNAPSKKTLRLGMASNLVFLIGAALYLRMAVISLQFARENGVPEFVSSSSSSTTSSATDDQNVDVDYWLLYWNQLPAEAKAAAQDLGYDQQKWDSGGPVPESDLWWDCLSAEQMEAAMVLGYNQAEWDGVEEGEIEEDTSTASIEESEYGAYTAPADPYAADDRRYTLLYIFASLCFVIVGILNLMMLKKLYPVLFVVAGLFGFISALYVTRNVRYSNIFNSVSIHFFFLEAIALMWNRVNGEKQWIAALVVADVAFLVGSIIELVLSYFYIFDAWADYDMEVNAFNTAAQTMW